MTCAALDWDKTRKDYIPCTPNGKIEMVRLIGMITVEQPLCDAHRLQFEEEMALYGGCLDRKKRVIVVRTETKAEPEEFTKDTR